MEIMNETEHQHYEVSGRNLGFAILLNIGITLAQSIGGIISGSMALLSDAAHNFSDVLSMIISFLANRLAKREATEKQTFGFRRSEILAAFINSATLILISGIILFEAIQRLVNPVPISANLVIYLAIAGILVNGVSVLFIRNDSHENMNIKSVYLHLFGDMLVSIAVLLGGLAMKFLQWYRIDSFFSIIIAIYLLYMGWGIVRSSLRIIMQFTPEEIDIKKIATEIEKIQGVKNIHHVHVWQINEREMMFEAHIDMSEDVNVSKFEDILHRIKAVLTKYDINHSTIQPELTVDDKKQIIY
jgi:cobalt-zinc-cadmium efflux system protein